MDNIPQRTGKKFSGWSTLIWIMLIWIVVMYFFRGFSPTDLLKVNYTQFKDYVTQGKVKEVVIKGDQINGTFNEPVVKGKKENEVKYENFQTIIPSFAGHELLDILEKNKVTIKAESTATPWFTTLLVGLLPWILIIGFFVYSSKKLRGMGGLGKGGPFGFGESKAKLYTKRRGSTHLAGTRRASFARSANAVRRVRFLSGKVTTHFA